ncbi:MAG: DUF3179 domain-containing (seleno)protein [Actinomycetota bacterium]
MTCRRRRQTLAAAVVACALLAGACGGSDGDGDDVASSASSSSTTEAAEATETPAPEPTSAPTPEPRPTTDPAPILAAAQALTEQSSSANAAAFIEVAAASGDERWVPWLLDLLRLNTSLQNSNAVSATLEDITGIPAESRIPDLIAYGSWSSNRGLDGGDGYRDFKVALYERIDPEFGPLLRSVADQAELAAIQWGGVPVGGIPELNDPGRVPAAEATWMDDTEIVLGVIANGESVAYPLRIIARHELANDTIGGDPLAIVYCTLCRSALVFEREVDGQVVQFLTSGLLSNSNKIMLDVETQTLWSHLRGVGIGGEHLGTELELRSVNHMRWADWVAENPDTQVLTIPPPIFFDDPERPPIAYDYSEEAYASYYDNPDVWFPVIDTPDVWPLKTEVVGIEIDGDSVAFSVEDVNELGETIELEVGGQTVTVEPTGVGVRVFDAAGERIIVEQSFWFAWFANHAETRTITDLSEFL